MAYDSIEWKSGDVITAEKLNQMETQITPLIGIFTEDDGDVFSLNLSYKDIHDAVLDGRNIVIYGKDEYENYMLYKVMGISHYDGEYGVNIVCFLNQTMYGLYAETETDLLHHEGK